VITIEITAAKMGLSIKKCENFILFEKFCVI